MLALCTQWPKFILRSFRDRENVRLCNLQRGDKAKYGERAQDHKSQNDGLSSTVEIAKLN